MKLLLLVLIALALVWLFGSSRRSSRRRAEPPPAPPPPAATAPPEREAIVACAHCGLMLPSGEALPGRGGVFCGDAHRTAFEKAQNRTP